jgi:hypothetical protein
MTDSASWSLPDTDVCSAALRLSEDASPAFLHHHCVRSFVFARELAAAGGLRGGVDYDEELVFLACVLHDLGLTGLGAGDQRFEVEGADAAARFLRDHGMAEDRVQPVWQAIVLHTSLGIADRFGPVPSIAFLGISLDIDGMQKHSLPTGFADRVHATWPRHDLGYAIADAIAADIRTNPLKAPPFTFPAHVHEIVNAGAAVRFTDVVANSGWGDQPVRALRETSR